MAISLKINKVTQSRIEQFDFEHIEFGKHFSDHMFRVDYKDGQWQAPEILPYGPIEMAPSISAIHYGQSIFEGMKAFNYNGDVALFRPLENWNRLNISAERMVMPDVPQDLFMEGLTKLIHIDRAWVPESVGSSLYIRPFMFGTDDHVGVRPSQHYKLIIFCCPVGPYYSNPLKVKVEEHYSRSAPGGTGFAKCAGNYGGSLYATKKAQEEGFDQVLWTDPITHKFVEETGTTNIFAVIGDKVVTPAAGETLLNGITRDSVIQVIEKMGVELEERLLAVEELKEAHRSGQLKELFITGTAATLMNLDGFSHKGEYFDVLKTGNTDLSKQIKSTLDGIRYGEVPDTFGWIQIVDHMVLRAH